MTSHIQLADLPVAPARAHRARRRLAAAVFVTVGISGLAAPVADAAPPVSPASPVSPATVTGRARVADPIADLAVIALATLNRYVEAGDQPSLASYEQQRSNLADAAAARLGIDAGRLRAAWAVADVDHQRALMAGLTQLGVPYRRNTSKAGVGFDCSGFTTYAWGEAGFTLTRQSSAQIRAAGARTQADAQAGDLVQYPGHVMMWLGVDNTIVHAVGSGRTVELDTTKHRSLRWGDPTG